MRLTRTVSLTLATAALAAGVAACGSSSHAASSSASTPAATSSTVTTAPASGGAASSTLSISAPSSGALMFSTKTLHAKAGKVTVKFTNDSSEGHNFTVAQSGNGNVVGATPTFSGGSRTLTVQLKAGTYTYYCSVPGHRQAGMQGTLTVS